MRKTIVVFCLAIAGALAVAPSWAAVLGNPGNGRLYSGIGVISGWKCQADGKITVENSRVRNRAGFPKVRWEEHRYLDSLFTVEALIGEECISKRVRLLAGCDRSLRKIIGL